MSRRLDCEDCSPPRGRPTTAATVAAVAPTPDLPRSAGELEVAVRAELTRADRITTWRGAAALRLAQECDTAKGSQVSSLIKQLEAAMAAAMDGVKPEADFVDEIAGRRAAKQA